MTDSAFTPGLPCWYELGSRDLDAAAFYEKVLGWKVVSSGIEGMDYRIAQDSEGNGVAGMMALDHVGELRQNSRETASDVVRQAAALRLVLLRVP